MSGMYFNINRALEGIELYPLAAEFKLCIVSMYLFESQILVSQLNL